MICIEFTIRRGREMEVFCCLLSKRTTHFTNSQNECVEYRCSARDGLRSRDTKEYQNWYPLATQMYARELKYEEPLSLGKGRTANDACNLHYRIVKLEAIDCYQSAIIKPHKTNISLSLLHQHQCTSNQTYI